LLTPYGGDNLGDGAIQEAIIYNIGRRLAGVQLFGITVLPAETEKRHGIPCFALTGLPIRHYVPPPPLRKDFLNQVLVDRYDTLRTLKTRIKSNRFFNALIKIFYTKPMKAIRIIIKVPAEFTLISKSIKLLSDCDLLIAAGGGQLDDYWGGAWGHPFSLCKWALIAKLTKTRFVFLSVGRCDLESKLSYYFIKWALKLADYRSYRDPLSKQLLANMSFTQNDPIFPDLAFSYDFQGHSNGDTKKHPSKKIIFGLSPIAYLSSWWPKQNSLVYSSYLQVLKEIILELLTNDIMINIFTTDSPDIYAIEDLFNLLKKQSVDPSDSRIKEVKTRSVKELVTLISTVDIVMASRLHGIIISHCLKKPVLALSYDKKVNTHMAAMEQLQYCYAITQELDSKKIVAGYYDMVKNKDCIAQGIGSKITDYRHLLSRQYNNILAN
jgi:polysaccharide pyruvyl transferase WcaK-like protein